MRRMVLSLVVGLVTVGCRGWDGLTPGDHYRFGQAAEKRGDVAGAIVQYQEAGGGDARSLYRLGVLYSDRKQYQKSADVWGRYVALEPRSAEGWGNLAQAREQAGDLAGAEGAYKRGIDADPEDHSCKVNYGLMLARHGREAEGRTLLLEVMGPAEAEESLRAARK